ncbi:Bypass of stop codon protein 6 [Cyberlindnera fabianii]|uniref:Bypass of stop codon protein 6 n=1 Tax=Cyberlindnera fabianii TaxID=36022 RepID=A0A1V2LEW2_CYBFA|nr:Bypass of stop codon protein 6 [Cyberlindnera fabianii]
MPEEDSSNMTLASKKSDFTIRDNILLQTPPGSPLSPTSANTESDSEPFLLDPSATYKVQYQGHAVHIDPTDWRHSTLLRIQIALCFLLFSLSGLADQTIGTLLPILVDHFETTQTRFTIVFMVSFCGYTTAAFINESMHARFGRRGVLTVGLVGPIITYFVNSSHNSLPLFIGMYLSTGLGGGLMGSSANVFLSSIVDHNELMGMLHGFYGLGSIISPPLVSWIAQTWGYKTFYALLACLYVVALIGVAIAFKHETQWKYAYLTKREQQEGFGANDTVSSFDMLKNKLILAFCVYLFFYVGGEIAIGSWLLTYYRDLKGMNQLDAAILVSWFWFGLTFGRMSLGFCTKRFSSEYKANTWYGWLSWLFFSVYAGFSMWYDGEHYKLISKPLVFIMGVFIGPLYPTASVVLLKLLPIHQHVSGVGIASSIGGSGSAVVPFIVGALSRSVGFKWLLLIIDIVLLVYCVVWELVPRLAGRSNTKW